MKTKTPLLFLVLVNLFYQTAFGQGKPLETATIRKPQIADTVKANIYADNTFMLYINGELVAVDSIKFIPHNVISVDLLPQYPMTIAVLAQDNADPKTGMEYANSSIGDGGFILKLGDGTVTHQGWKARVFTHGPINRDTENPQVKSEAIPDNWFAVDFDDGNWKPAKVFSQNEVGPKSVFHDYDFEGAEFIWSNDLALDNIVIFRHRVESPPDGRTRTDFSNINNVVPESGRGKRGGGRNRKRNRK